MIGYAEHNTVAWPLSAGFRELLAAPCVWGMGSSSSSPKSPPLLIASSLLRLVSDTSY